MEDSNGSANFVFNIPYVALKDSLSAYYSGAYQASGNYNACACYMSKTSVKGAWIYLNGVSKASSMVVKAYCK